MAFALTQNRDDALELVQDSMLKLVQKYAGKPEAEWKLLFYRILHNRITDFHRRRGLRQFFSLFSGMDDGALETTQSAHRDTLGQPPEKMLEHSSTLKRVFEALKTLPLRQQQAFLLRAWQEFDTRETAYAMSITTGSVKTHYNRALNQLRHLLGDLHD